MNIPIQNIYCMLVYAWDVLEEADALDVKTEGCTRLLDLFGRVLHTGTERVLRHGLDRNYLSQIETIPGIRGKINISASIKGNQFRNAKSVCETDDLSHDVIHNRILKSTIRKLMSTHDINPELRRQLAECHDRMKQIAEIELNYPAFRAVQLHGNNRGYRLLLDVCRLIQRVDLPNEASGENRFRDFFRDDQRMRRLFEKFIRNFYKKEQSEFDVVGNQVLWGRLRGTLDSLELVPQMRTDIRLLSSKSKRQIVIETKFVPRMMQDGRGGQTIRSSHLYQLFAYMESLKEKYGLGIEGVLLYPAVGMKRDIRFEIADQSYRACTLDLNQPWKSIHSELLALIS